MPRIQKERHSEQKRRRYYILTCRAKMDCRLSHYDKKDDRRQEILYSTLRHKDFFVSEKQFSAQCFNQLARLEPDRRWRRKNMKGYHLREIVVD